MKCIGDTMEINLELTLIEAQDCEGELTQLTFRTMILNKKYQYQMILCDPASYDSYEWNNIGANLSRECKKLNEKLEKHLKEVKETK